MLALENRIYLSQPRDISYEKYIRRYHPSAVYYCVHDY